MKSVAMAVVLTAAMGGVVVLAGRDVPVVQHETVYLNDTDAPTTRPVEPAPSLISVASAIPVHR